MDEITRRQSVRGLILEGMKVDKNQEMSDIAVKKMIWGFAFQFTMDDVRREFDYLVGKGLITIKQRSKNIWIGKLTSKGVDLLDGVGGVSDDGIILGE